MSEEAEEFWVNDYSQRKRTILSEYHDKMNFAQAYADKVKKDDCINFANWLSKLSPSQKTSVWSKDGAMSGLFTMDNEQLYQRWLKEQLKTKV